MKRTLSAIIMAMLASGAHCAFRDMNWSVRSSGMGGAFVALADDASGPLVNPAGMTQISGGEADFMYSKLFTGLENVDMSLQYASVVREAGKAGTIGLAWTSFETKDAYVENTAAYSHAVDLGKAAPGLKGVSAGITLKYLQHKYMLDGDTLDDPVFAGGPGKWAVTADAGVLAVPSPDTLPGLTIGAVARNVTQPDVGLDSTDRVPLELAAGSAFRWEDFKLFNSLVVACPVTTLDVQYRMQDWGAASNKWTAALGMECWMFREVIGLRAGVNSREVSGGISFDIGLAKDFGARFDYAVNFPLYLDGTTGTQRGSLLVRF